MAKLYWKVKKNGKWIWAAVNSETTNGDFEQLEYIGGDCESQQSKPPKSTPKRKPKSKRFTDCYSVRFCDDCGDNNRMRTTASHSFECPSCKEHFPEGSRVVFQHYCMDCFAEDRPSESFTPMVNLQLETYCSSCFTIGGKRKSKSSRRKYSSR
jgi:hypothetical protein